MNEKDLAGASYIITFYKEVQDLTSHYANYSNILLELENRHGITEKMSETEKAVAASKMPDEEKAFIIQQAQLVRYAAYKCYIEYHSIMLGVGQSVDAKLIESYKRIKSTFIINRDDLESYVMALNAVIVKDVI